MGRIRSHRRSMVMFRTEEKPEGDAVVFMRLSSFQRRFKSSRFTEQDGPADGEEG